MTPTRLASLLNSAAGLVAKQEGAAFVDLDAVPEEGLSLEQGLSFVLSPEVRVRARVRVRVRVRLTLTLTLTLTPTCSLRRLA